MKIDKISDGFDDNMSAAGVEDAASKSILATKTPKDIDNHRALIPNWRSVGILTGPSAHLDHLGVLCELLGFRLIVTEEKTLALAARYYPHLQVEYRDLADLSLPTLTASFDLILHSGKTWSQELQPLCSLLFGKAPRMAYCPHGNSDKGEASSSIHQYPPQDIVLYYGEQMRQHLKQTQTLVRTGNYRFAYFQKQRSFYTPFLPRLDPKRKTIFYAPTWPDPENPHSFFSSCASVIEELTQRFNLMLKLHPFFERDFPAQTALILETYSQMPHLFWIHDFPPIYPLLEIADIYLGDFSSISYDFLAFNRPLFFLGKSSLLRLGMEVVGNAATFIEQNVEYNQRCFEKARQAAYAKAFGNPREIEEIRSELRNLL